MNSKWLFKKIIKHDLKGWVRLSLTIKVCLSDEWFTVRSTNFNYQTLILVKKNLDKNFFKLCVR